MLQLEVPLPKAFLALHVLSASPCFSKAIWLYNTVCAKGQMAINCKFLHHTCLFGAPLPLNVGVIGSPAPWPKEETPSRAR